MWMRVMVVDDDGPLARALSTRLAECGLEAHVFASSADALAFARGRPIGAVLAELSMVDLDGVELLERLRDVAPRARRYLMCGCVDDPRIDRCLTRGVASCVFRKPFSPARVVDRILRDEPGVADARPVESVMVRDVACAPPDAAASEAAALMHRLDCGFVPIVGDQGELAGVVTDRDLCMAAFTTGRPLHAITLSVPMSRAVHACRESDTLDHAARTMREAQVRRLPVVDAHGRLVGVLALGDLARLEGDDLSSLLGRTLAAVSRPRRGDRSST